MPDDFLYQAGAEKVILTDNSQFVLDNMKQHFNNDRIETILAGCHFVGLTAMTRTTAFPAVVDGLITDHGALRQEQAIPPKIFVEELRKRNINFREV